MRGVSLLPDRSHLGELVLGITAPVRLPEVLQLSPKNLAESMKSFFLAFFGGVLGTMLSITICYVDFSDFEFDWEIALRPLFIWPWISFSIILTLSNMAWPFVTHTVHAEEASSFIMESFGIMIVTTFVSVLVAYPGEEALGVLQDGSLKAVILCCGVVQFFVMLTADNGVGEVKFSGRRGDDEIGATYRKLPTSRSSVCEYTLNVGADLGVVTFECNVSCAWDSWRTLETGGNLYVAKGSSITTRHSLFVNGQLEVRGGSISSDNVITLKTGRYVMGDLKARHLISFGDLTINGDLTVSGSVVCEGEISCSGRVLVGGGIEAYAVCSPDPDRVRRENTLGRSTRVEILDQ